MSVSHIIDLFSITQACHVLYINCWDGEESHLQEEARALGHEGESNQRRDRRKSRNQDKNPPAVELELCAHTEAPAYTQTMVQSASLCFRTRQVESTVLVRSQKTCFVSSD